MGLSNLGGTGLWGVQQSANYGSKDLESSIKHIEHYTFKEHALGVHRACRRMVSLGAKVRSNATITR